MYEQDNSGKILSHPKEGRKGEVTKDETNTKCSNMNLILTQSCYNYIRYKSSEHTD